MVLPDVVIEVGGSDVDDDLEEVGLGGCRLTSCWPAKKSAYIKHGAINVTNDNAQNRKWRPLK